MMARAAAPRDRPAPIIPPIISAGTQIIAPIHTIVMDTQLCLSSVLISKAVVCFMFFLPKFVGIRFFPDSFLDYSKPPGRKHCFIG